MRVGYSSVGGGQDFHIFELSRRDVEEILALHLGLDPNTVNVSGLDAIVDDVTVSGSRTYGSVNDDEIDLPSP